MATQSDPSKANLGAVIPVQEEPKKKGLLSSFLSALPDLLAAGAQGYSAGAGPDANTGEAAAARGFSTGYQRGEANKQQDKIKSVINAVKATPSYGAMTEQQKAQFELDPIDFLKEFNKTKKKSFIGRQGDTALFVDDSGNFTSEALPSTEPIKPKTEMPQAPSPVFVFDPIKRTFTDATGKAVNANSIPKDAKVFRSGQDVAGNDAAKRANKLGELNRDIDFFEKKVNEIPVGSGLVGRVRGAGLIAESKLQSSERGKKAAAYISSLKGLRSQIAKGLGQAGNLSEVEQQNAISLLPDITDNDETRAEKIKSFREYIATKLSDGSQPDESGGGDFSDISQFLEK